MRKLNKLHMMVQTGEKPDGEKIYERDEVKLDINSTTHGVLDRDRVDISSFGKMPTHGDTYDLEIGQKGLAVDGPMVVGGVSLQSLPSYNSFRVNGGGQGSLYIKIAEVVRDVGSGQSTGVALITGGGMFGNPNSDVDILQVGTRGNGVVRYLRLMKAGGSSNYGYVDNSSTGKREIWIEGSTWNGISQVNVLQQYNVEFKEFTRTTTKPSGWVDATQITIGQ